jgi:hypothetical protein
MSALKLWAIMGLICLAGYGASLFILSYYEGGYSEVQNWSLILFWILIATIVGADIWLSKLLFWRRK